MGLGWIRDYAAKTTAVERRDFTTPVFSTRTGSTQIGTLTWGAEVDVDEDNDTGSGRLPITTSGQAGFVARSHVVRVKFLQRWLHDGRFRYDVPLYRFETGSSRRGSCLWGDTAQIRKVGPNRTRVRVRGKYGWVKNEHLTDESLLEVYFVDVGQGDGVLVRTPDRRHLLVDGGYPRHRQPTRRNVADFVDWKWFDDYGDHRVRLDDMIASHCDLDHYGGLDDLLNAGPTARAEMDCLGTDLGAFHHAGVSWWKPTDDEIDDFDLKGNRTKRWLGPSVNKSLRRLLGDHADATDAIDPPAPQLQGMWEDFIRRVVGATDSVNRLGVRTTETSTDVFLPGYDDADPAACSIRVLGPVTKVINNQDTVADFEAESQNTNGHSIALRLDYGACRILLTGDLNKSSMQALATAYGADIDKFSCDVAKACHHGSEDVSFAFLKAMEPAATVISSGDAEGHAHPRAAIVAASGLTGFAHIDEDTDEIVTPLVYSTEVERGLRIGRVDRIETDDLPHGNGHISFNLFARRASQLSDDDQQAEAQLHEAAGTTSIIQYGEAKPGSFRPKRGDRNLRNSYVVAGVVYGLVNVRTNGTDVMCATMKESGDGWTVRSFAARH